MPKKHVDAGPVGDDPACRGTPVEAVEASCAGRQSLSERRGGECKLVSNCREDISLEGDMNVGLMEKVEASWVEVEKVEETVASGVCWQLLSSSTADVGGCFRWRHHWMSPPGLWLHV